MTRDERRPIPDEYLGRDVGQLSEDLLKTWISGKTALTLNSVQKDKEGWDVILEFPFIRPQEGEPWDTAPPRVQCWVQVKGTDTGATERNVKLDNWQKLINTPLPAFFLIYEFGDDVLQVAYLVHVHGTWMEKVLRRLRKTRQGKSPPLHAQNVTLTWSEEEKIEPINGEGLVNAILQYIGEDLDAYVHEKQKTRRELGLDAPYLIHVTSRPYSTTEEMYQESVDFALGLRQIKVSRFVVETAPRFGIPSGIEDQGESLVTLFPEGSEVTLSFRNETGVKRVEFPGTIVGPEYFFHGADLPSEFKKYRLKYPLGEIIFSPVGTSESEDPVDTTFRIEYSEGQIEMGELVNNWRIVELLQNVSQDHLEIEIRSQSIPPTKIGEVQNAHIPEPYRIVSKAVEDAWFLVRYLDLPLDMKVTLAQIILHREYLGFCRMLLDVNQPPIRAVTINSDNLTVEKDVEHALVIGRLVKLGDFLIFVAAGIAGPLQIIGGNGVYEISRPARAHVKCRVLRDEESVQSAILAMYDALEKKGYEVIKYEEYLTEEEE